MLSLLFVTMLGLPLLYAATPWLDLANDTLPAWGGGLDSAPLAGWLARAWASCWPGRLLHRVPGALALKHGTLA